MDTENAKYFSFDATSRSWGFGNKIYNPPTMRALQVSAQFICIFPSTLAYVSRYDTFPGIRFRSETSIVSELFSRDDFEIRSISSSFYSDSRFLLNNVHTSSYRVFFERRSDHELIFCDFAYRVLSLVRVVIYIILKYLVFRYSSAARITTYGGRLYARLELITVRCTLSLKKKKYSSYYYIGRPIIL